MTAYVRRYSRPQSFGYPARWLWVATGIAIFLAVWVRWRGLLPGDVRILHLLESLPQTPVRILMLLGSIGSIAGITVLFAWIFRDMVRPLALVGLMAVIPGLELTLKALVHRARPNGHGLGFPSGHAMASLTLVLLICLALWPRLGSVRKLGVVVVSAMFVLGIALSRVASGVHWPSDVLGGWMVSFAYVGWTAGLSRQDLVPSPISRPVSG